ncbi:Lrp/AsnC family transcriptional regulator [Virgibacillus sp. C22-A2]|uniref:Lrp/AsnC family transcriptional regulator n=1 Tax=Virgibacillus tibetensis TaxID=3042313 RepID=A0ABU6KMS2_9BACI|nr:Lrp/AsnC family transcriptional regulator [Virgibacillus sp. C22-A2]
MKNKLGEKVHLTGPAVSARVAKLEDQGVIEGYSIKVNGVKLGCYIHTFIAIINQGTSHQPYLSFIKTQEQQIIYNFKVSGEDCYLLECKFPSNEILTSF